MRRREAITLLSGAAATWTLAARAAPHKPVIGFIYSDTPDLYADIEGQNVAIEYRRAEGRNDRLPALTADLTDRQVSLLVATTTPRR
jgi:putative ABC transport system substrate-binding protein